MKFEPHDSAGAAAKIVLCGDVMTGRGIDQLLPHPGRADIHEPWLHSAVDYLALGEERSGPVMRPVAFDYIWGDALSVLASHAPEARIVNLETAVTASDDAWPGKAIHYRMHPANIPCLTTAGIDCCVLANNHVMDWSYAGLNETLAALHEAGIATAGAGHDEKEACQPAVITLAGGSRLLVFALALVSSGVPLEWAAAATRAGVHLLAGPTTATITSLAESMLSWKQAGDIVLASIHWGGNWGYRIPAEHRQLARQLIDSGAVHVIHGHSSHHPLGLEIYRGHLILYGCGDFFNDYEGIEGYESYRPDLALMYLPMIDRPSGRLARLDVVPMQIRRFRLNFASIADARWLAARLTQESRVSGARFLPAADGSLRLEWTPSAD